MHVSMDASDEDIGRVMLHAGLPPDAMHAFAEKLEGMSLMEKTELTNT